MGALEKIKHVLLSLFLYYWNRLISSFWLKVVVLMRSCVKVEPPLGRWRSFVILFFFVLTDVLVLLCTELCDSSVLAQWGGNVGCLAQCEVTCRLSKGNQQHKIIIDIRDSGMKSCLLCFTVQLVTNITSRSTFSPPYTYLTSQVCPVDLQNNKYSRYNEVLGFSHWCSSSLLSHQIGNLNLFPQTCQLPCTFTTQLSSLNF